MRKIFFLSVLCSLLLPLQAQENDDALIDSIQARFTEQLLLFPQQKIYVQTDKPHYIAGEKIWFRAHLADACFHLPDTTSRYVYAELINPEAEVVNRVKVVLNQGAYSGCISLPIDLPDGEYLLRCYTRWLENQGEDSFFKRKILVGDVSKEEASSKKRKKDKLADDFHVDFFPEGGHLIRNTLNRVAFKALNSNGLGEDIAGIILNQSGDTLLTFQSEHLGMGSFFLAPDPGEKLTVVCKNASGKEKIFKLSGADDQAVSLQLVWRGEHLIIQRNKPSDIPIADTHYLLIHCRGDIHSLMEWNNNLEFISLDKGDLPSGVIHVLLVNNELVPVSERLIFNQNRKDVVEYNFVTNKEMYTQRDLIEVELGLYDLTGNALSGNWSVSVTDDNDVKRDSTTTILTTLLLTSDLRGHIENPASYFDTSDKNASKKLDVLLMTQGWRRHNVANLLQEEYEIPTTPIERSMHVAGLVKSGFFFNKRTGGNLITLFSTDYDFFKETKTLEDGTFLLDGFEVPDSTRLFVVGKTPKGKDGVELLADEELFPEVKNLLPPMPPLSAQEQPIVEDYLEKAELNFTIEYGSRHILLKEVVIKKKRPSRPRSILSSPMNDKIGEEEIERMVAMDAFEVARKLPRVSVSNGAIYYRGSRSPAYVFVDDMPWFLATAGDLSMIPVDNIESIELVRGPRLSLVSSMYGGGGIISITTKRGGGARRLYVNENLKEVNLLGYQRPVEFYSPKYETYAEKTDVRPDLRTTIYWNPAVETDESGTSKFQFYSSDAPTTYSVVIEGIDSEGKIVHVVEKIRCE